MSDAPVLEPILDERQVQPTSANRNINECYWRRGPNEESPGWIIVGPGPETAQALRWQAAGREALVELSLTDRVSPKTRKRERIEYGEDNLGRNRFYWLLKNGGGKEFPISQVVAYKWHIKPPYGLSKEAFPQLEEYELPDPWWCPLCSPRVMPKNSASQLLQHIIIGHGLPMSEAKPLLAGASKPPVSGGLDPVLLKKQTPEEKEAEEAERAEIAAKAEEETRDMRDPTKGRLAVCHSCGTEISGSLANHDCT
ncbi:hypothetical protein LCGC14_2077390 [marine sediment metagenome]|uniref:Uncharacterized protein n=1 Tax=marine sediment metagenome TaxID=412755 RepID=A0A0F9HDJ1_9ZZZZ